MPSALCQSRRTYRSRSRIPGAMAAQFVEAWAAGFDRPPVSRPRSPFSCPAAGILVGFPASAVASCTPRLASSAMFVLPMQQFGEPVCSPLGADLQLGRVYSRRPDRKVRNQRPDHTTQAFGAPPFGMRALKSASPRHCGGGFCFRRERVSRSPAVGALAAEPTLPGRPFSCAMRRCSSPSAGLE